MLSLLIVAAVIVASLALAPTGDQAWLLIVATPIALLLAWWRGGLHTVGFARPERGLLRTFGLAAVLGTLIQLVAITCFDPFVEWLTGEAIDLSDFVLLEGNLPALMITLVIIWTLVAFGEEIVFRGILITELDRVLGTSRGARAVNVLLGSAVFGAAHLYQGVAGVVTTGVAGLLLAWIFLREERNLWLPILVHGWIDTAGLILVYLGLYDDLSPW
ncbi:MAG: type II CAAX endopeptidase family protein [Acidobacteriota bacterium]